MIETVVPILRVENPEASKRYYLDVLGFTLDWEAPWMMQVSRDGRAIMLCERHQGQAGAWVWIGVEDAGGLHAELVAKGALIRDPPQNFDWAYEFQVQDPDGHVLRFGSEPKSGPTNGAFKP